MKASRPLDSAFLSILRCPVTQAPLFAVEDEVVALAHPTYRYPVRQGIPILIPGFTSATKAISAAFERRSTTYFEDNYSGLGSPRSRRLAVAVDLITRLAAPGDRLLDVGSGPAVLAEAIQNLSVEYVALDLSLDNLLEGRRRAGDHRAVVGDVTALPIRTQSFGIVVALGSLEYVQDTDAATRELARVMKHGGYLLATFANAHSLRRRWEERLRHPLWRVKERIRGRGSRVYRRYLTTDRGVQEIWSRHGLTIMDVQYIDGGKRGSAIEHREFLVLASRIHSDEDVST